MAKLSPAPSHPVDLLPAERRQESQVLPDCTPMPERGPATNRDEERRAVLASLKERRDNSNTQAPKATVAPSEKHELPNELQTPQENSTAPRVITPQLGLFSQLKEKLSNFFGIGASTTAPESGDQSLGLVGRVVKQFSKLGEVRSLADLGSWAKGMTSAFAPSLRSWSFSAPKPTTPQSLNIKPPVQVETGPEREFQSHTVIVTPPTDDELKVDIQTKKGENLTEKALTAIASAKQAEVEEKDKKDAKTEEQRTRDKDSVEAALRKLQLEGLSASEIAEISTEMRGVYGTAESALRQANDLLKRKKVS